jgi:hypothetical protein
MKFPSIFSFVFFIIHTSLVASTISPADLAFFESNIRPVLVEHCYSCHSNQAEKIKANLLLDTRSGLLNGGDNGASIVPGNPDKSLLIQAIRYHDADTAMPPKKNGGKLADSIISNFEKWVAMGAPDPREGSSQKLKLDPNQAKKWWSFQPLKVNPELNSLSTTDTINLLIEKQYQDNKLSVANPAKKEHLLRRLFYDLTGLPPPVLVLNQWLALNEQQQEQEYHQWVDRLLNSDAFA